MLAKPILIAVVLSLLASCADRRIGISGAAALRVEIEVYKGPVGQSPEIQAGELAAQLLEAARDTDNWTRVAVAYYRADNRPEQRCTVIDKQPKAVPTAQEPLNDCVVLRQAVEHAREIVGAICDLHPYWIDKAVGESGFDDSNSSRSSSDKTPNRDNRDLCQEYGFEQTSRNWDLHRPNLPVPAAAPRPAPWSRTTIVTTTKSIPATANAKDKTSTPSVDVSRSVQPMSPPQYRMAPSIKRTQTSGPPRGGVAGDTTVETTVSDDAFGGLTPERFFCDSIVPGQPTVLGATRVFTPTCSDTLRQNVDEFSRRISTIAALMRSKATTVAEANIARQPDDRNVRLLLAEFSYIAGNAAGRIGAGVSVLQKVYAEKNYDRSRNLPVGDYLRGSSQSGFLQAFKWFDAALDRPGDSHILKLDDRMRAMDALTGDYYWQKVNEVFASGQGDVSMALIKDDLGNWNLKNFSNAPGKLLAAYRGGVNALIATGVKLAAKTSGPGAIGLEGGRKILGLANQLARGDNPETQTLAGLDIATLHARTLSRMSAAEKRFADAQQVLVAEQQAAKAEAEKGVSDYAQAAGALTAAVTAEQGARDQAAGCTGDCTASSARLSAARDELAAKQTAERVALERRIAKSGDLEKLEAEIKQLPAQAAAAVQLVLADHAADLVALQGAVAGSEPAPTAAKPF